MKILDLDLLVSEKAFIKYNGKEFEVKEPNLYQWGIFIEKNNELISLKSKEEQSKKELELREWMAKEMIPSVDITELPISEFIAITIILNEVFLKGISFLGKKLNPLEKILKVR